MKSKHKRNMLIVILGIFLITFVFLKLNESNISAEGTFKTNHNTETLNNSIKTMPKGIAIRSISDWNSAMSDTTEVDYYLDIPTLSITTTATVSTNKHIDLNGNTLNFSGNNGKLLLKGYASFTDFTLFSSAEEKGKVTSSGHTSRYYRGPIFDGRADNTSAPNLATDGQNANLIVTFKNLNVDSSDEFAYLFLAKEIIFKGKNDIYTEGKGVVATNITMYGNENDPNDPENADIYSTTGTSTNSPSEYAFYYGPLNFALAPNYGTNNSWDKRGSENAKFLVQKNAKVYAENNGTATNVPYQNVIANYRHIENNGTLRAIAKNYGSALRTITSNGSNAQTPHASIRSAENSVTEISTLGKNASYGAIFSYKMDLVVDNPEIFDVKYFGRNQFFYAYDSGSRSTVSVKNMNHAVWNNNSNGVGNPSNIWQGVSTFEITGLHTTNRGTVTSSDNDMQSKFNFNQYSRWSNDILLPVVIVEKEISLVDDIYEIPNNKVGLSGHTDYKMPDGSYVDKPAINAELTLTVGADTYKTTTDDEGNWHFSEVDFKKYAGGTTGKIQLVDDDLRNATVEVTLIDKLPPTAKPVSQKTTLNSVEGIPSDPRQVLTDISDETTPTNQLTVTWKTTEQEKQERVKSVGLKELAVIVTDAAGNSATINVPLLVIDSHTVVGTNGAVRGKNFVADLADWNEDTARATVIDKGEAKGYLLAADRITEVTEDADKFTIDIKDVGNKMDTPYPITLIAGDAKKTITVTFKDTQPPSAKSKVTKINLGDSDAILNGDLKQFVTDLNDNSTPVEKIQAELIDPQNIEALVSSIGVKTIQIKFTDESDNASVITTQIFVYDDNWILGATGAVTGKKFTTDQSDWSQQTIREIVIAQGSVKGFDISGEQAIDITADSSKLSIDTSNVGTEQGKAYPIILEVGDASKTITVTFKDTKPPIGTGKLTIINLNDIAAINDVTDYTVFLSEWSDNVTSKDNIKVALLPDQDIPTLVSKIGSKSFKLQLTDEAGNSAEVDVPIFVKDPDAEVSKDKLYVLNGKDFSIAAKEYPTSSDDLTKLILDKGHITLQDAKTGENLPISTIKIDNGTLPDPEENNSIVSAGNYEVTLSYGQGDSFVSKKIIVTVLKSIATVTVEFLDEEDTVIFDPVVIEGTIGQTIDLTINQEVMNALEAIQTKKYILVQSPKDETAILVTEEGKVVRYKFKGTLFIESAPSTLDFGIKSVGIFSTKVDKASYDKPLIIWDNRENLSKWTLTATLQSPLTSQRDQSKILPDAIRYKINAQDNVVLSMNNAQPITTQTHHSSGQYSISEKWDKGESGFMLEIPAGGIRRLGEYQATILLQLGDTP